MDKRASGLAKMAAMTPEEAWRHFKALSDASKPQVRQPFADTLKSFRTMANDPRLPTEFREQLLKDLQRMDPTNVTNRIKFPSRIRTNREYLQTWKDAAVDLNRSPEARQRAIDYLKYADPDAVANRPLPTAPGGSGKPPTLAKARPVKVPMNPVLAGAGTAAMMQLPEAVGAAASFAGGGGEAEALADRRQSMDNRYGRSTNLIRQQIASMTDLGNLTGASANIIAASTDPELNSTNSNGARSTIGALLRPLQLAFSRKNPSTPAPPADYAARVHAVMAKQPGISAERAQQIVNNIDLVGPRKR